jgi:hypothetical protein
MVEWHAFVRWNFIYITVSATVHKTIRILKQSLLSTFLFLTRMFLLKEVRNLKAF